jgi:hypothetical protein
LLRDSLGQLRRNGWLTIEQAGTGQRVGLGERARKIAGMWGIDLTPGDAD